MAVADDLEHLLHPYDQRDIPVPGFPSCDALAAWAATQPRAETVAALTDALAKDELPQQYAAMAVLRSIGVDVRGVRRENGKVEWSITDPLSTLHASERADDAETNVIDLGDLMRSRSDAFVASMRRFKRTQSPSTARARDRLHDVG